MAWPQRLQGRTVITYNDSVKAWVLPTFVQVTLAVVAAHGSTKLQQDMDNETEKCHSPGPGHG